MITRTELVDHTNLVELIRQMEKIGWAVRLVKNIGTQGFAYLVVFEGEE